MRDAIDFMPSLLSRTAMGQKPVSAKTTMFMPASNGSANQYLFTNKPKIVPVKITIPAISQIMRSIYQLSVRAKYIKPPLRCI